MHHPFAAQVDPRTGLLHFRLPLVTAIGNDHLGPEFALSLSYSLLHLQDVGYGKGFDDNLSRYDPESRLLTLSNGEQYRLEGEASEPAFCPPAPLHIRLKMLNGALWIYYKSGAVEQLIIPQAKAIAQKYYLLNRVFSPAGHEILFTYIVVNGRLRLAQIKDAQQSLVEIKWPSLHQVDGQPPAPNHVILTVWPGLAQSYSLLLQKEQGKLTRVSQCDKNSIDNARCRAGALCEIGYDSRDRLTSLRLPGGINEDFVYCADGAVRPLPCMASHTTRVTDNQRELYRQTQTFQFTGVDFLTANAPLSRPDMLTQGKIYSSKITIRRDNRSPLGPAAPETGSEIITRRYDSYHRLVSEKHQTKITMNNQLKESEHTLILSYRAPVDAATTTPLAQLARTYCLPTRKEEHWRTPPIVNTPQRPDQQPQKKTITHYNYDADGNLTLCVYPDGSQFTVNYFNADGSDSDCPADPLGFRRFAAEVSYEIPPGDIPTTQIRRIYYHYGALSCHRPSVLPHDTLVLCHKVTYAIYNFPLKAPAADAGRAPAQDTAIKNVRDVPSRVDVKTLEVSYYDEPEATFGSRHGRLKSQRMTYTGEPEKTVVSKDYFWEKRSAKDNTPTDYELVCTCHFSVSHTRPEPKAAPETAAAVPQGSTPEDDAPQMTPARTANEAQQTLTTTSIWSLPDYHLITTIDAQGNQTDCRYQNNDLDFFLTRHAQTPCAAIQCRTIRYDLQQNSLVHISETDSLGNGVHRYIDGFGRLHRKTYCSARRADNPVTLEERRYDGAGRLIEATLNDWHIAATTLAPSQQIAQHRGEYYYDEWGQLNVFLHHDGERGQYHLIDNAIFDDRQTREQFPYDVASRSVDLRACASGVIEEHYDIVNRPLKLLRETRSAITLEGFRSVNKRPPAGEEASALPDLALPLDEAACEIDNLGKLISAAEFIRDDMQRIIAVTETLSQHYVNYQYDYQDRLCLMSIGDTGNFRYVYDRQDGPPTQIRFSPPLSSRQPLPAPAADHYQLYVRSLDGWGRILSEKQLGQGANAWRYEGAHPRPIGYTDAGHNTFHFRYHRHLKHALIEMKYADGLRRFHYDNAGRVTAVQDHFLDDLAGPCLRYQYNSEGQVIRETVCGPEDEKGFWTEYDYSLASRLLQSRDSLGQTHLYRYDRAGRLITLTGSEVELSLDYDAFGRLAQHTVTERATGKGVRRELRYGFFNRVTKIAITPCGPHKADAKTLQIALKYDGLDNIIAKTVTETSGGVGRTRQETFSYDRRGYLTNCHYHGNLPLLANDEQTDRQVLRQEFKYDDLANLTEVRTETVPLGDGTASGAANTSLTTRYFYHNGEAPTRLTDLSHSAKPALTNMLLYDSCGRLVQDHQGLRYYYDRFGHLILTLTPNHDYKFYHYDPAGRLFACGDERGETVYLYSQNRLTHVKRYTRDTPFPPQTVLDAIKKDDVPNVAGAINGLTAHINLDKRKNGLTHATLFYYGNTHALITRCERQPGWPSVLLLAADQQGNTVQAGGNARIDYLPWGLANEPMEGVATDATLPEDMPRYQGCLLDSAVNGYFMGGDHRLYQPEVRRFISPATLRFPGVAGLNPYTFMMNDPVNQTFPNARGNLRGRMTQPSGKEAPPLTHPAFDTVLSATPPLHIMLAATDFSWAASAIASGSLEYKDPMVSCALLWSSKMLALAAGCDEPVVGEHRRRQSPLDAFQSLSLSCLKNGNNQVNHFSHYRYQNPLAQAACPTLQNILQRGHHGSLLPTSPRSIAPPWPSLLPMLASEEPWISVDHPLLMLASYAAGTESARQLADLLSRPMATFTLALRPAMAFAAEGFAPSVQRDGSFPAAAQGGAAHAYLFFMGYRPAPTMCYPLLYPDGPFAGGRPLSEATTAMARYFPGAFCPQDKDV